MKQVCIVVPVYKSFQDLSFEELLSLDRLFKILNEYDIFLICSHSFDPYEYLEKSRKFNVNTRVSKFKCKYFHSIQGYNKLMLAPRFYRCFKKYSFMLIYQLDAFVFSNCLNDWCNKDFDFIGAPWFEALDSERNTSKIIGVGNGGFSLRKIKSIVKLLVRFQRLKTFRSIWLKSRLNSLFPFPKILAHYKFGLHKSSVAKMQSYFSIVDMNEDYLITQILGDFFLDFKVAPSSEAIAFSFEVNPSVLFSLNGNTLPFGCHAWEKYEPEFWQDYIPVKNS